MLEGALKKIAVIIPAAGTGERFAASASTETENPKQFALVGSGASRMPLIVHTLNQFSSIKWVGRVIVVVQDDQRQRALLAIEQHGSQATKGKTQIVLGDLTRHRSIKKGVETLENLGLPLRPQVVVVQDGVRPFVDQEVLRNVVLAAGQFGSAGVCAPLVSTIVQVDSDGLLISSLPRVDYRASEMPQAFSFSVLQAAYNMASEEELQTGTECLALAQKYGACRVKMIPVTSDRHFKVTTEKDLLTVHAILAGDGIGSSMRTSSSSEDFVVDARQVALPKSRSSAQLETDFP